MADTLEFEVEELGARGDGIAQLGDIRVIVPGALPGELVRARLPRKPGKGPGKKNVPPRARLTEVIDASPLRVAPACAHFGACGGCTVQHIERAAYLDWKRDLIADALARRGLPIETVGPIAATPPGARRRADFAAIRRRDDLVLGFHGRASHQVLQIGECPVLRPEIVALLDPLRALLGALLAPSESAGAIVNATDSGLDLLLVTTAKLGASGLQALAEFAAANDLARLSRGHPRGHGEETIATRRTPTVGFGGIEVAIPPGAFLQASAEGEAALTVAVLDGVGEAGRVADLYCGVGTFALPLAAAGRTVFAADGSGPAVRALSAAANRAQLRGLAAERRDLERQPLRVEELNRFDAVVFDPPRAGAKRQAEALAQSKVPVVVALSCSPGSFARDAAILVEGGYALDWVRPVDQFLWSPHVELAARFSRQKG